MIIIILINFKGTYTECKEAAFLFNASLISFASPEMMNRFTASVLTRNYSFWTLGQYSETAGDWVWSTGQTAVNASLFCDGNNRHNSPYDYLYYDTRGCLRSDLESSMKYLAMVSDNYVVPDYWNDNYNDCSAE